MGILHVFQDMTADRIIEFLVFKWQVFPIGIQEFLVLIYLQVGDPVIIRIGGILIYYNIGTRMRVMSPSYFYHPVRTPDIHIHSVLGIPDFHKSYII
jgi:hypothetical protein